MEKTLENKARFFAQYWGQKVMTWDEPGTILQKIGPTYMTKYGIENRKLALKPLSMISDEDKIIIDNIEGVGDEENPEGYFNYGIEYWLCHYINGTFIRFPLLETYQYLQSKGYAVPFMGLSVEKLIDFGWVKLKKFENEN